MSEYTSESGSDLTEFWVDWFLGIKGNEYFCDVDADYVTDRFNLTGLNSEVEKLPLMIEILTDNVKIEDQDPTLTDFLHYNSKYLYGLIHSRYILTVKGLLKMADKFKNGDFGYCPRVYCKLQPLLPVGLNDIPRLSSVKLYCPKCEDLYNPKSSRHSSIDGAFFGTSFPAMFFQQFPQFIPSHPIKIFEPKIFGFKIHDHSKLKRWQELQRLKLEKRLNSLGIDVENPNGGFEKLDDDVDELS